MKIVLDTNVLGSGLLNFFGPPGRIVDLLRSGVHQLVVDDRILAEYEDVLSRPYFRRFITDSERKDILEFFRRNSFYSIGRVVVRNLPDADDAPFLEIAISEKAPLITGNIKHFPIRKRRGVTVVTPAEFVRNAGFNT